ncbi:WD40-repeat-containing domain protein [Schizophyllum commune]
MQNDYTKAAILSGQRDGILSLSFSARAKFIAATGYAGVSIWDVAKRQSIPTPPLPSLLSNKHVYTRSQWLYFEQSNLHVLVLGSKRGDVTLWRWCPDEAAFLFYMSDRHSPHSAEVLSIDILRRSVPCEERGRVAVSTGDNHVTVWMVDDVAHKMRQRFSIEVETPGFCPKTVKFQAVSRTLIAFSERGGLMARFDYDTGKITGRRRDGPSVMASIATDPVQSVFAAYTGTTFEIMSLNKKERINGFQSEVPDVRLPMAIAFGEGGTVLLAGTDKGRAMLYNVTDGTILRNFKYPKGGLVQQVVTCTTKDRYYVAYAGSSIHQSADVVLYTKARSELNQKPQQILGQRRLGKTPYWRRLVSSVWRVIYWAGVLILLLSAYEVVKDVAKVVT